MRFFVRLAVSFFLVAVVLVAFAFIFGPREYSNSLSDPQHNTGTLNPSQDQTP